MKVLLSLLALAAHAPTKPADAMIAQTGSARHTTPARNGSGIAGTDLARPTLRGTAGGAGSASSGINGGVMHRRK